MLEDIFKLYPNLYTQKSDVIYHSIGEDFNNNVISCGFMRKESGDYSQYNFSLEFYSCFILLSGRGNYIDQEGRRYPIEAGSLVQRFPNMVHSTQVIEDGEWLEFFINFGKSTYQYLRDLNLISTASPVNPCVLTPEIMSQLFYLLDTLKNAPEKNLPILLLDLQKMVLILQNNCVTHAFTSTEIALNKAKSILSANLYKDIPMEMIAEEIQMGYENFRKVFKESEGISPMQYRTNQRMYQAKLMILSGVTIKETAQLVGYGDSYSFSKQFKKSTGISPAVFRKKR